MIEEIFKEGPFVAFLFSQSFKIYEHFRVLEAAFYIPWRHGSRETAGKI